MGLVKVRQKGIFIEDNILIKNITDFIEDNTIMIVPPKTSIIYKKELEEELKIFQGDSEYLCITMGNNYEAYCVRVGRFDNCRSTIDVHGEETNINGFIYFTWRISKPELFISKFKENCKKSEIVSLISKQIEKNIEKSYDENSLIFRKNIRKNINKVLYTFGVRVINVEFEGLISLNENAILKDIDEDILVMEMEAVLPACKNCGYQPNGKPPKFCPECGTKFEG